MIVVASMGTDHHRFTRLAGWLEDWLPRHPDVELRVQHGATRPVSGARNVERLTHQDLTRWLAQADAAVLQGGPGGIMDALSEGMRPIVVPRLKVFDEVVDDHQLDFCSRLADDGVVALADSQDILEDLLDETLNGRLDWRTARRTSIAPGVLAVREHLCAPPRRRESAWRRARALHGGRRRTVR
ncbi:MAG: hypothetical protein U0R64_03045 [Candidatus Nanopelagicales bacterium]